MSIGIGIGVAIAVAIGCMDLQKPITTATPIPIPMIATQSEHDIRPDPHLLLKRPPIYGLISNTKTRRLRDAKKSRTRNFWRLGVLESWR